MKLENQHKFYIDGQWVEPHSKQVAEVINPATEEAIGSVILGDQVDVDRAVAAARRAFDSYSQTTVEERVALLERIIEVYERRMDEIGEAVSREVGAPLPFAKIAQATAGRDHFKVTLQTLKEFEWEKDMGRNRLVHEPIGVCALITPWNWPLNQIVSKVAPALAAGCTIVLKPSEIAPLNTIILAEVMDEAGTPPGVFNLVNGDGPGVGTMLAKHPDVDMISFTGSTRAGVLVAQNAAPTVKRVTQELGGKSANIILDDANMEKVVAAGFRDCARNTGQSCSAPTRMLVPMSRMDEVAAIAKKAAEAIVVGDPADPDTGVGGLGPVVSRAQWDKVQGLIRKGIEEGATLVTGGPGLPDGLERGYYVKPTVFSHVTNDMTIAREEIFGPVLVIIGYEDEDDAVRIANDTPYGLAGYVQSADLERARRVGRRIRAGYLYLNGAPYRYEMPFGGYKQSGNGRENGAWGLEEYLETKAMLGYYPKS